MASRNLHSAAFIPEHVQFMNIQFLSSQEANVYDIVRREKLVISAAALKALQVNIVLRSLMINRIELSRNGNIMVKENPW